MTIPTAALLGFGGGGGGGGTVDSVTGTAPITVDNTDPANPIVGIAAGVGTLKVRLAASTNSGRTGLAAIDGVTPVAGDRILCLAETAPANNGIYVAAAGAWSRATDFDTAGEMIPGVLVSVTEGTVYQASLWMFATTGAIVVGTTALSFAFQAPSWGADARATRPNAAGTEVTALRMLSTLTLNTAGAENSRLELLFKQAGVDTSGAIFGYNAGGAPIALLPDNLLFILDQDTGLVRSGANTMNMQASGLVVFGITTAGITLNAGNPSNIGWGAGAAEVNYDINTGRLRLPPAAAAGNTEIGLPAALATNATHGFGCINSCAGTPTGTPVVGAGIIPLIVDTTNAKLYGYYGGAWHDLTKT